MGGGDGGKRCSLFCILLGLWRELEVIYMGLRGGAREGDGFVVAGFPFGLFWVFPVACFCGVSNITCMWVCFIMIFLRPKGWKESSCT